jgi:3-oxoacyl-[acyl-carrier protein] reductase
MMLEGRNAVVYGGGGAIGGAVARAFAREGARVFLAGRTLSSLDKVAAQVRSAGGHAEVAEVDALDESAVDRHAAGIAEQGGLHISMNVIGHDVVQGTPLIDMAAEDYVRPITTAVTSTFLTARAAARHMRDQGGGVILMFGGSGPPFRGYSLGSLQVVFEALESMRRQLASELGRDGIRAVTLRTGGIPETLPAGFGGREQIVAGIEDATMLGRAASLEDVGNAAVFAASDWGRTLTATTVNISCGTLLD